MGLAANAVLKTNDAAITKNSWILLNIPRMYNENVTNQ
jgi:hypothetical protein